MRLHGRKVRVIGVNWLIQVVDIADHHVNSDEGRGYVDANNRTIYLDKNKSQPEDVWHELIHALEYAFNLALKEHQVQAIARGQLAILRDNPWLAEGLLLEDR